MALLTKERNALKEIVASYDAEEANFAREHHDIVKASLSRTLSL